MDQAVGLPNRCDFPSQLRNLGLYANCVAPPGAAGSAASLGRENHAHNSMHSFRGQGWPHSRRKASRFQIPIAVKYRRLPSLLVETKSRPNTSRLGSLRYLTSLRYLRLYFAAVAGFGGAAFIVRREPLVSWRCLIKYSVSFWPSNARDSIFNPGVSFTIVNS